MLFQLTFVILFGKQTFELEPSVYLLKAFKSPAKFYIFLRMKDQSTALLCFLFFSFICAESAKVLQTPVKSFQLPSELNERQISPDVFKCDFGGGATKVICSAAIWIVNGQLKNYGITINRDNVLFDYVDGTDIDVDTGSRCNTARITQTAFKATITTDTGLELGGDFFTEPLAVFTRLSVRLDGRADVTQRFAVRLFRRCRTVTKDDYRLVGSLDTVSDIGVSFWLDPTVEVLPSGDVSITIEPKLSILFSLENDNLSFSARGVSLVNRVLSTLTFNKLSIYSSIIRIFHGDSLKSVFQNFVRQQLFGIGTFVLYRLDRLPGPFRDLVFGTVQKIADRKAQKAAAGFRDDLEDKLNRDIRNALGVGSDGKKTFTVSKNILDSFEKLIG